MTVKSDLKKVLASCEEISGSYAVMAEATEDQMAKEMFNTMKADVEKHIQYLKDRLEYLTTSNPMNQSKK